MKLLLKENTLSYTKLQTKLSTNYDSVKNNIKEMEEYGFVKIEIKENHAKNGHDYSDVKLTPRGHELANKYKDRNKQ